MQADPQQPEDGAHVPWKRLRFRNRLIVRVVVMVVASAAVGYVMLLAYKSATPEQYFFIFMVLFVVLFAASLPVIAILRGTISTPFEAEPQHAEQDQEGAEGGDDEPGDETEDGDEAPAEAEDHSEKQGARI